MAATGGAGGVAGPTSDDDIDMLMILPLDGAGEPVMNAQFLMPLPTTIVQPSAAIDTPRGKDILLRIWSIRGAFHKAYATLEDAQRESGALKCSAFIKPFATRHTELSDDESASARRSTAGKTLPNSASGNVLALVLYIRPPSNQNPRWRYIGVSIGDELGIVFARKTTRLVELQRRSPWVVGKIRDYTAKIVHQHESALADCGVGAMRVDIRRSFPDDKVVADLPEVGPASRHLGPMGAGGQSEGIGTLPIVMFTFPAVRLEREPSDPDSATGLAFRGAGRPPGE